jgi:hypothetical protein
LVEKTNLILQLRHGHYRLAPWFSQDSHGLMYS